MKPLTPKIQDDRSPPRSVPLWVPSRSEGRLPPELEQRFNEEFKRERRMDLSQPVSFDVIIPAGAVLALLVGVYAAGRSFNLPPWQVGTLLALGGMPLAWLTFSLWIRHARLRLRSVFVAGRHCASCGYNLANLPTSPDGLTICPECDAAWRLAQPDANMP